MKLHPAFEWDAILAFRPRADSLFPQIEEFQSLSSSLDLSEAEELVLLQLTPAEWSRWRVLGVNPADPAPDRLTRRLAYAVQLLRRMQVAN